MESVSGNREVRENMPNVIIRKKKDIMNELMDVAVPSVRETENEFKYKI